MLSTSVDTLLLCFNLQEADAMSVPSHRALLVGEVTTLTFRAVVVAPGWYHTLLSNHNSR
jgi:hypothetical protein